MARTIVTTAQYDNYILSFEAVDTMARMIAAEARRMGRTVPVKPGQQLGGLTIDQDKLDAIHGGLSILREALGTVYQWAE